MCSIFQTRSSRHLFSLGSVLALLCLPLWLAANGCAAQNEPLNVSAQAPGWMDDDLVTYWPVAMESRDGQIEMYQPQPEKMNRDTLTARAAVSLTRPGSSAPLFGVAWFTAQFITDRDTRTVTLYQVTVNNVRLPGVNARGAAGLRPRHRRTIINDGGDLPAGSIDDQSRHCPPGAH
jgi:hypothetical protein